MAKRPVQVPGGEPSAAVEDQAPLVAESEPAAVEAAESLNDEDYREAARGLRAKDVDPTRLRRAVLTLDGWVCPAASPEPKGRE